MRTESILLAMSLMSCHFLGPFVNRQELTPAAPSGNPPHVLNASGPFTGWSVVGSAKFTWEDGILSGAGDAPRSSFLVCPGIHGDFEFACEVWIEDGGNSGIQIRSEVVGNRSVRGYQIEVDSSSRRWSGGLYDEARRGWLQNLEGRKAAKGAFQRGEWNHYRIECEGPRLRSWVNGIPVTDYLDVMSLEGVIALQVHSGHCRVKWRNMVLADRGRHGWERAWDGRTFEGWQQHGGGEWTIKDGILTGRCRKDEAEHGFFMLNEDITDFTARFEYMAELGDSGLYFRVREGGGAGVLGFQAEIDDPISEPGGQKSGGLYETGGRGWLVPAEGEDFTDHANHGGWNSMVVCGTGDHIVIELNGFRTVDRHDWGMQHAGHLALQLHGGQDVLMYFRKIEMLKKRDPGGVVRD